MRIALQMDPIESIHIDTDSSFLLGLGAEELGHAVWYWNPKDLFIADARLMARARKITLRREKGSHFSFLESRTLDVAEEIDVLLLRQNLPIHMGYVANTLLLEHAGDMPLIINNPSGVRDVAGKIFPLRFPEFTPPTFIGADAGEIKTFTARHGEVVAKRLFNSAGIDVFRFKASDPALLKFAEEHFAATQEPIAVQAFLPDVFKGDKRIILFDGAPVAAINRIPANGEFRANMAQGATPEPCAITPREKEICQALAPHFRERGLLFVGIDVIGGYLTEVNPGSPTGLQAVNKLYGLTGEARMEMRFWKMVTGKLKEKK